MEREDLGHMISRRHLLRSAMWLVGAAGFLSACAPTAPASPPAPSPASAAPTTGVPKSGPTATGPASTGAAAAQGTACYPGGASGEVVFQTSGGTFGDALQRAYLDSFQANCGVTVVRRDVARSAGQLVAQVQAGQAPFDVGSTQGPFEYPVGVQADIFYKLPANFWDPIRADMAPGSVNEYGTWCCPSSIVLVYSTQAVPTGMRTWSDFWDTSRFPGPRSLPNNPITLHIALLADGVAPDKIYPYDLERAFKKLDQIRPAVRNFTTSQDQPVQQVVNGEVTASAAYNSRVNPALQEGKPIAVSWTGNIFQDAWFIIPKTVKNVPAAQALMYWLAQAEPQAKMAQTFGLAGGNKKVADLIAPEVSAGLAASHLAEASRIDSDWLATNNDLLQTRWSAWVATGSSG